LPDSKHVEQVSSALQAATSAQQLEPRHSLHSAVFVKLSHAGPEPLVVLVELSVVVETS